MRVWLTVPMVESYPIVATKFSIDLFPSPFGFGKGEGCRRRGEGSTRYVCYEGMGLIVISPSDGERV